MTMLDRMRRHRNWLKWSLALVCLAFVVFYIPDFLQNGTGAVTTDAVAVIDGEEIRADEFRRAYMAQMQSYRAAYGGQMTEQLLRQLGVDQEILQRLVEERAAMAEAQRLGLSVSDEEVAQRIYAVPSFQENGVFIGAARYQQVLAAQRPPLTTTDFETSVRRSLLADKLRSSVTEWMSISDKEIAEEYRRRNDKVKLAVIAFNADSYRPDVNVSDADLSSYFEAHKADFTVPEKRKVKYLLVDVEALRAKVTVAQADVERRYNDTIDQYSTPAQLRASHILLKTEGKDDAAVKAAAEDVLRQAKAPGADFAALARKHSEDESNAPIGGDLDFFGRGRMVPEFDTAAFALEPGQMSELVKTDYGYHIIKVTAKQGGTTRTLEEVRQQLTDQIAGERAQAQADALAATLAAQLKTPADLDAVAKAQGMTVQETGFFAQDEPILGLGSAPEMTARAFSLNQGEVSGALRVGRGVAFETLVEKKDSYIPTLDEARDRVRTEVTLQQARAVASQKARELAAKLKAAPDFDRAAKAANVAPQTTELLTKDAQIPELGQAPEVLDAAFALPMGAVSDAIATTNGAAIIKVLEKHETTDAGVASNKDALREELMADRRNRFFSAYMAKAKQKMRIQMNPEALQRVIG